MVFYGIKRFQNVIRRCVLNKTETRKQQAVVLYEQLPETRYTEFVPVGNNQCTNMARQMIEGIQQALQQTSVVKLTSSENFINR